METKKKKSKSNKKGAGRVLTGTVLLGSKQEESQTDTYSPVNFSTPSTGGFPLCEVCDSGRALMDSSFGWKKCQECGRTRVAVEIC